MKLANRIVSFIVSVILIVMTSYFLFQLFNLNVLPIRLLIPVIIIFVLIDLILLLLLNWIVKRVGSKVILCLLTLGISFAFGFGGYYLQKTNSLFNNITSSDDKNIATVSVVVMDDSSLKSENDLPNANVGVLETIGKVGTDKMVTALSDEGIIINEQTSENLESMVASLYNDEVDAIILNESSRSNVEDIETYSNFSNETRVIYQTTYEVENTNKAKSVADITNTPFNVLITGSDSRVGLSENSRSDVVMVVTVNPKTGTILMTSIPRDYYVTTVCDAADGCQNGALDKITHTGVHGVNTTKMTVENLLGIDINYTFKVGFESVEKIVDALGGVDVTVEPGYANDNFLQLPGFSVHEGVNHLNGEQALAYSRERYAYTEGDRQRTKNQQQVLMGIIDKITSPAILSNYSSLMDVLGDTFQTNMSTKEIQSLIQYQLSEGISWNIKQSMVDGTGSTEMCAELGMSAYVMIPNDDTVIAAQNKIIDVLNE